jgi:lipopolysaccharide export system protein LptA
MAATQQPGGARRLLAAAMLSASVLVPAEIGSAQSVVSGAQQSATDAVQIEADQMDVNQETRQAVFTGNVDALQGGVRLQSDKLVVDYDEVSDDEGTKTDVTFLTAEGNVVVTSKGQTVTAQWAKLDVRANTAEFGDEVTITEGSTVLRGGRLHLNLNTGESRLVSGGGRVQGTF